ncbi:MAG: D-alanine-D-alanine ligase [Microgenomates group bacterium GW2011_GWA2_47_8]|nr:MAG: D-alanine-D-alanine ligase [Microgenomates group bacterium GW2011_GWA2_47_8]
MRITIIYSLPTSRARATPYKATDEDTKDSAEEVAASLTTKGAAVELVAVSEDSMDGIAKISADVIFNLIEWDGLDTPLSLAAFDALEATQIPYTGATKEAIIVCNDKAKMKAALDTAGLPTPRWQLFVTSEEPIRPDLQFPVIIKLAREHCSVGLTKDAVVARPEDLPSIVKERVNTFHQPVYAEEFITGREFQVTLLDSEKGLMVLPPAEIMFDTHGTNAFLTYNSRWEEGHADYKESHVTKATLTPLLMQRLYRISHKTFRAFGFHDYSRLDIRLRGEEIFILEANANPGLGDSDDYGMTVSYKAVGMTFADFCWEVVGSCLRRNNKILL